MVTAQSLKCWVCVLTWKGTCSCAQGPWGGDSLDWLSRLGEPFLKEMWLQMDGQIDTVLLSYRWRSHKSRNAGSLSELDEGKDTTNQIVSPLHPSRASRGQHSLQTCWGFSNASSEVVATVERTRKGCTLTRQAGPFSPGRGKFRSNGEERFKEFSCCPVEASVSKRFGSPHQWRPPRPPRLKQHCMRSLLSPKKRTF